MMYSTKTFDCQFPINGKKSKQNENIKSFFFVFELVSMATKYKQTTLFKYNFKKKVKHNETLK